MPDRRESARLAVTLVAVLIAAIWILCALVIGLYRFSEYCVDGGRDNCTPGVPALTVIQGLAAAAGAVGLLSWGFGLGKERRRPGQGTIVVVCLGTWVAASVCIFTGALAA